MSMGSNYSSFMNVFSPTVTGSNSREDISYNDQVNMRTENRLVYDLVDKIFDERTGHYECSSSYCSSVQKYSSEYSFDKRLNYWKSMVQERKDIAKYIKTRTGKKPGDVLFNRAVTVDQRDKETVKRLMDYADRMNPITLQTKKQIRLPEYWDEKAGLCKPELQETLPQAERDECKAVEICGLPAVAKEEQLGKVREQGAEKKWMWLKSQVLECRINEKREDLERVIEYYPDIENLQVVGESLNKAQLRHNSEIHLLPEEAIQNISSDSSCNNICSIDCVVEKEEVPEYGLRVNEHNFAVPAKRSSKNVEIEVRFECEPFQKMVRHVLTLENIGRKVLNCEWVHRSYYDKNAQLLKSLDEDFLFNNKPFRLIAGDVRDIYIQFRPRRVDVIKEKWLLKVDPQFFCRKIDSIVVRLCGKCRAPPEYVDKVNEVQSIVIEKSNMKMMSKLTSGLAAITPLMQPMEAICPYKRTLSECELFEHYNEGYKCERYHDLELLKNIYQRVKKPREHEWDLRVDSLKIFVLRMEGADQRALMFNELMGVLQEMKGNAVDLEVRVTATDERDRSRFVFVRGIISTGIDEWEELTVVVEEAFLKPAVNRYYERLIEQEEEDFMQEEEDMPEDALDLMLVDENAVRKYLLKKQKRLKAYRDSLFVQTYTHLCNVIEDIVSVIESTEVI